LDKKWRKAILVPLFLVLAQQQEEEEKESFLQFVVDWNWLESDAGTRRLTVFCFLVEMQLWM
jgi:hypothetical protein